MLKVVVERSKWGSGDRLGKNTSKLYNDESGLLCCLGFACLAAGNTLEDIEDLAYPHDLIKTGVAKVQRPFPALIDESGECTCRDEGEDLEHDVNCERVLESSLCRDLTETNDSTSLSAAEREATLINLGQKAGIEFVFVGTVEPRPEEVE